MNNISEHNRLRGLLGKVDPDLVFVLATVCAFIVIALFLVTNITSTRKNREEIGMFKSKIKELDDYIRKYENIVASYEGLRSDFDNFKKETIEKHNIINNTLSRLTSNQELTNGVLNDINTKILSYRLQVAPH